MHNKNITTLIFFLLFTSILHAETKLGRLPDGRAYRVGSDGVEMVDHLAELELTVEELKTRVHGLEYELEEKSNIIQALKQSGAKVPEFKERDLINPAATTTEQQTQPQAATSELSDLRVALQNERKINDETASALDSVRRDFALLQDQRDQLLLELKSKSDNSSTEQVLVSTTAKNNNNCEEIATIKAEAAAMSTRYSDLEKQYQQALNDISELSKVAEQSRAISTVTSKKVSAQSSAQDAEDVRAAYAPMPLGGAAVEQSKSDLKTYLNRIRGMNLERDRRYRLYRMAASNTEPVIRIREPRTKQGYGLLELGRKLEQASSSEEIKFIRSEVDVIRDIIEKDMAMIASIVQ